MTALSQGEQDRRAKISAARRERGWASNDGSVAREANMAKSKAFAQTIRPVIDEIAKTLEYSSGVKIAAELNRRKIPAARGGLWSAKQVDRVLQATS